MDTFRSAIQAAMLELAAEYETIVVRKLKAMLGEPTPIEELRRHSKPSRYHPEKEPVRAQKAAPKRNKRGRPAKTPKPEVKAV